MNDPKNLGLGELGQRVQALGDPAPDSRLRPYQGTTPPSSPANGRIIPPYEPAGDPRPTPGPAAATPTPAAAPSLINSQFASQPFTPASPPPNPSTAPPASRIPTQPSPASAAASSATAKFSPWESVSAPAPNPAKDAFSASGASAPSASAPSSSAPPQWNNPPATAPVNASGNDPGDPNAPKSGLLRAINAVKSALPIAQKLLPLLDGNVITAVGALLAPHTSHPPQPPPTVHVDLEPVERGLAEVRTSNRELRTQVQEQATSLKRVEDQLDRVREATDRNTLEQQELLEDLRSVGSRITTFAVIGIVLLVLSLALNGFLLYQLQHILR